MKILDRYLVKQFVQTIFFGLLAFTLIFVVIDAMENLDDFIDQNVTADIIFHYYFVFSPEIIKLVTPIAVLFAAMFTAGKAASTSELTAIKASGVSLVRFMAPFLITTFFLSCFSIYFSGYVVPMANKTKLNIEMTYLKKGLGSSSSNIFFQDSRNRIVSISFFDNATNTANRVSIQDFDAQKLNSMVGRVDALKLVYDSTGHIWMAINGSTRKFEGEKQSAVYFKNLQLTDLNFTPKDLSSKQQKPVEMNLDELNALIDSQKKAGNNPASTQIEYHSRIAFSMASLIVVLFGLPLSANRRKAGLAAQVGLNILITFIYLVFMKVSQAFGKNGSLDPVLTAWVANLVFVAAALINLPRVKQ